MKVECLDRMGSDLSVVNAARCSFDREHTEFDEETDTRLLRYLAREKHWTPFAAVTLSLRITAPIFVSRQLEKHYAGLVMGTAVPVRSEVSRRYVDAVPEFYFPEEWRSRPEKNIKQGSGEPLVEAAAYLDWVYRQSVYAARKAYDELLSRGVAPEMARMVLPQSLMTTWIWTGSLAAFHRVYALRVDSHAQQESQVIAEQIGEICAFYFPRSWDALNHVR
jgi:thymidylate synthase (FAD)